MEMKVNLYKWSAALLAAGAIVFYCARFDKDLVEPATGPQQEEGTVVYTLTVQAHRDTPTKALADQGETIESSWASTDKVEVYDDAQVKMGELTAAESATGSTTLSGDLTTVPDVGDALTFVFRSADYETQEGTLEYIAAHCDYATAEVTVTEVSDNSITTDPARFESRQAIVKFSLKSGGADLAASQLLVRAGSTLYTVSPTSATSELYVALPALDSQTVTLSAKAGSSVYELVKDGVTFENGTFYRITPTLVKQTLGGIAISGLDTPVPAYSYRGASVSAAR